MKLMHTTEARSIIDLQARDKAIDDLAARIVSIPEEILALKAAFEEKKSSMNTAREALIKLKVDRKAKELAVAEKEEEIRKHHRDLNTIKNNDAYKALQIEIARAQKEQDDIETEILGLLEELDAAAAEDGKLQQEAKQLEEDTSLRIKALEDAKKDAETALSAARTERAAFASGIGAEILEKYEFIREQRKGLAVAHVIEDKAGRISCGGCNMGLTAQKIVDIKTPDALVFCDNCQRMIYLAKTVYG
jgi:uncharacterized protein